MNILEIYFLVYLWGYFKKNPTELKGKDVIIYDIFGQRLLMSHIIKLEYILLSKK